ncbi:MAG: hypothetical protein HDT47_10870 [Ruminococcaceae bacterium]|nr:hypothetical protein [Oscillospiraceae bacterium]
MPTETIKCPACGEEVTQEMENCPSCGAPTSVLFDNDISGAPIDNSAAIDAMLRSASQFIEESESLGLDEMDIFDEDEEEEEEETVFKKVTLRELPPELSEEQKDGIQSGGIINLSSNGEASENKSVQVPDYTPAPPKAGGSLPDDLPDFSSASQPSNNGIVDQTPNENTRQAEQTPASAPAPVPMSEPVPAPVAEPEEEKKSKKEKKSRKDPKGKKNSKDEPTLYEVDEHGNPVKDKPKKEKRVKEKKPKAEKDKKQKGGGSPLTVVIAAVIALAVGLGGGYFGKMFIFPDLPVPECQSFAQRSVDAVVTRAIPSGMQIYIAEAYVNDGAYSSQCIFRAFTQSGDDVASRWFRVKVNHDNESKIEVFLELNSDEYERLRNSENSEERGRAAVLKSNQNELERCIKEANAGNGWSSANISLLNNSLHPYEETAQTEASKESADAPHAEE